ncbi:S-adenosyl-L-methionine-dependent methyltransferase [Cantharellus anzutake]|uniref:S-adenosyl-L-methionine-dependent methyltransferase n=1 Tax=Cantharellus anzutake TaxID=1750568 RepID=UPI0019080B53|nr:S-adenosyl-L-methionine-dependent methyltransferase [Cantharellus anzutake]KAF8342642.1 S-adenosyl-L-methionine-dependent methyltransferase [Cantharellus anzutake]
MDSELDAAVRATDTDAAQARLSAVNKGYLSDDVFIQFFIPRSRYLPPRPPLINVGTFIRATAIDMLVDKWIQLFGRVQVVSLGAGSDTRFWRLSTAGKSKSLEHYVEIDFPENTARKAHSIRKNDALNRHLEDITIDQGGTALRSTQYSLIPLDLRNPPSIILAPLISSGLLKRSIPTLFLSECVFVYMPPAASDALVRWFGENFEIVGGTLYEMFGLTDEFGKVMRANLMVTSGVDAYQTLEAQSARYLQHDYTHATSITLKTVRRHYIPSAELQRIAFLEMLDEIEELDLVLDHYVLSWGVKVAPGSDDEVVRHAVSWGIDRVDDPANDKDELEEGEIQQDA